MISPLNACPGAINCPVAFMEGLALSSITQPFAGHASHVFRRAIAGVAPSGYFKSLIRGMNKHSQCGHRHAQ